MLEIIGDSHLIALGEASRQPQRIVSSGKHGPIRLAQLGHGYNFLSPFFSVQDDGSVAFTQDAARTTFRNINKDMPDVIMPDDPRRFVFVFGLYASLGFNEEHWTRHTATPWSSNRQFVSKAAFNAIIDDLLKQPLSFFRTLKAMNVRFSVASCCPIPASYQQLAKKTCFAEHEVAFIYNRFRDRATQHLQSIGVTVHHPPAEVYDEHGAMFDRFAKQPGDYHANTEYGVLMLNKIFSEIEMLT